VPVGLVVAELDLALKGGKLAGLLLSAGVRSLDDGFLGLQRKRKNERKQEKKKEKSQIMSEVPE